MSHGGERELLLELSDEARTFLSAAPADSQSRRLALGVLAASALVCIAAIPFAKTPLPQVPAFIPLYQAAMIVCDLITAVLLVGQLRIGRSSGVLFLAAGYFFTALMAVAHGLSFPGLFSPAGLLGSGPQTTAWLYFLWHAGFPLFVLAYALRSAGPGSEIQSAQLRPALAITFAGTLVAAASLFALATAGHELLPVIMRGQSDDSRKVLVAAATWAFSFVALAALWRRRPHSVMDLWLIVVLCAWIFDIALAAVFNGGRYDLGFYAGRVYGLLAGSFVLIVFLVENARLYGRLIEAYGAERRERQRVQEKTAELVALNKELDAFAYSVSHDLRAPLRAIDGYARILEEDFAAPLTDEGRRLLGVVRASGAKMGRLIDDLLEFSRLGRQAPVCRRLGMTELARNVAAELGRNSQATIDVGDLPLASADPQLLRQVWINLIGNALKYSAKRAEPRIEIGGRREAGEAVYWVRDNGAGFDMRYAERLFGAFQRLHRNEDFPGTGVGLAIVQRVIARHGGRVWADAQPGEGATFFFSLPAQQPADEDKRL